MPSRIIPSSRHRPSDRRNHHPRAPPAGPSSRDLSPTSSDDLPSEDRDSDESRDARREQLYRDVNRMGGLSAACEELFVNEPARRAARERREEVRLKSPFPLYQSISPFF